jgi:Fic family protein
MIAIQEVDMGEDLRDALLQYLSEIDEFRQQSTLDPISLAKLEEHFKAAHIYHSTGIEGNRLTLQETNLVLKEGIDISGKPLKDTIEVKQLGMAFDYLKQLSSREDPLTEVDIRHLHQLIVGNDSQLSPGAYRTIGVVISGSEHRAPEPIVVPARMRELVEWINFNMDKNPVIVAAVAHHELTAIHPFVDGNGRVSRLLMNLILLKKGAPICNIKREDRPKCYQSLSFADVGLYEPLIMLIHERSTDLFSEYVRIRNETRRMADWAKRWGTNDVDALVKRESREMELWQSRVRQIFLEFQKASELLDDNLQGQIEVKFYDYKTEISFEDYQQLKEKGQIQRANAFSISFRENTSGKYERFMFRYFRNWNKFPYEDSLIPLELNRYETESGSYIRLSNLSWADRIRLREIYFTDNGEFIIRYYDTLKRDEIEERGKTVADAVQWFFDDILQNVFGYQ